MKHFIPVIKHRVEDIVRLTHKISLRIANYLERKGFIYRDAENCYLNIVSALTADVARMAKLCNQHHGAYRLSFFQHVHREHDVSRIIGIRYLFVDRRLRLFPI